MAGFHSIEFSTEIVQEHNISNSNPYDCKAQAAFSLHNKIKIEPQF